MRPLVCWLSEAGRERGGWERAREREGKLGESDGGRQGEPDNVAAALALLAT